jgi:hypothetical protein
MRHGSAKHRYAAAKTKTLHATIITAAIVTALIGSWFM